MKKWKIYVFIYFFLENDPDVLNFLSLLFKILVVLLCSQKHSNPLISCGSYCFYYAFFDWKTTKSTQIKWILSQTVVAALKQLPEGSSPRWTTVLQSTKFTITAYVSMIICLLLMYFLQGDIIICNVYRCGRICQTNKTIHVMDYYVYVYYSKT